jgi:hypothetical protein
MKADANYLVLRCQPNGSITRISPDMMRRLAEECQRRTDSDTNVLRDMTRANEVAELAFKNRYYGIALGLYKYVYKTIFDEFEYRPRYFRFKNALYTAADGIDKVLAILKPGSWPKGHARHKAYYYLMSFFDDYKYTMYEIDYEILDYLKDYEKRYDVGDPSILA